MTNKQKNPWKKISSRDIYTNPWIHVREDQVINPAGNEGIYGLVKFMNKAVGIIPIDEKMNTWLVGQYRYALDEYSWELPMGGCKLDEDTLVGAKRELQEETGIVAKKWTEIIRVHLSNSVTDEVGYVFIAEDLTIGEPEHEDTEKIEIKKVPLRDAIKMAMDCQITDALSVAGLLKLSILNNKLNWSLKNGN